MGETAGRVDPLQWPEGSCGSRRTSSQDSKARNRLLAHEADLRKVAFLQGDTHAETLPLGCRPRAVDADGTIDDGRGCGQCGDAHILVENR